MENDKEIEEIKKLKSKLASLRSKREDKQKQLASIELEIK